MIRLGRHLTYREVMTTVGVSVAILASALAVCLTIGVGQASASPVSCGDTITTDTKLHHNLTNCPNNGIVIGANNITLDLNGHRIDGDGTPTAGCPVTDFCDIGVAFEHNGVTVKHGSIRGFEGGLGAFGVRHARLLGLSTSRNHFIGIGMASSARILIRNCSGNRATAREGDGVGVFYSDHVRILNSTFRHNPHTGIKPIGSTNSVIKGNLVARNGDEGFLMEGGKGFRVKRNRLVRNGGGITLGPGSHNVIKRNHVFHGRDGIRIEKGHGNLVAHNVVADARRAGIRLGIKHPLLGGAHNVVRRNVVRDSHVDGFLVGKKDRHSLLKHNVAKGAGDDGFDIQSHSTTLTRNRAVRNADLGIEAVPGVIDGGGNRANDNGDSRQCTNVACN
jgi:nitrous oxidase accessory protein NosD